MRQELAAIQQQLDLLNAKVHDLQEELKAVKAAHASMSNPLEELLLQKITDMHQAVSEVVPYAAEVTYKIWLKTLFVPYMRRGEQLCAWGQVETSPVSSQALQL